MADVKVPGVILDAANVDEFTAVGLTDFERVFLPGRIMDAAGNPIESVRVDLEMLRLSVMPELKQTPLTVDLSVPGASVPIDDWGKFVTDSQGEKYYADGRGFFAQVGGGSGGGDLLAPIVQVGGPATTDITLFDGKYALPNADPPNPGKVVIEWVDGVEQFRDTVEFEAADVVAMSTNLATLEEFMGHLAVIRLRTDASEWHRLLVYDDIIQRWKPLGATVDLVTAAGAEPVQAYPGDMLIDVPERALKYYDNTGSWEELYSEATIRALIAQASLFQGTLADAASAGAIDVTGLPVVDPTNKGFYFVSAEDFLVSATGNPLDGQQLRAGDWIVSLGDDQQGLGGWAIISGDLISKSRADGLYGLHTWQSGKAYEDGSLVTYAHKAYRASTDIQAGTTPSQVTPDTVALPAVANFPLAQGVDKGTLNSEAEYLALVPAASERGNYWTVGTSFTVASPPASWASGTVAIGDGIVWDGAQFQHIAQAAFNPTTTTINLPQVAGSPWVDLGIGEGIAYTTMATLPMSAPTGDVYLVWDDPAVGQPSLQTYDNALGKWTVLGGGAGQSGPALNLSGGARIYPAVVKVQSTMPDPTKTNQGSMWFNPDLAELYIFSENGNWVQV